MKKYIIIATAALAALASCTKVDIEQPERGALITFDAVAYKNANTKTAGTDVITGSTYPTTAPSFGVYSYYSADTWALRGTFSNYLNTTGDATEVTYGETTAETGATKVNAWHTAKDYYWPLQGYLNFKAYSPYTGVTASYAADTDVLTIENYTPSYTLDSQKDLMWSTTTKDKQANDTDYEVTTAYKGVPIVFTHALSMIYVTAKTDKDYGTDASFKVYSVKLLNLDKTNTLTVTKDSPAWGTASAKNATNAGPEFVPSASQSSGIAVTSSTAATVVGNASTADGILVLPQSFTSGEVTKDSTVPMIAVEYSMTVNGVESKTTKYINLYNTALTAFAPNTKYVLNLTLAAKKILYSPDVVEWTDGGTIEY